jgi:molybdopterin-guanine dinucleotide biosynthesis protein A
MGGRDKGLLPLGGRPMVAHAIAAVGPQVDELLINANRNFADYRTFGCRVVNDGVGEFFGPLAGMLAALEVAHNPYLLSVPCDSPLLPGDYAPRMVDALLKHDAELSVAHDGRRLQPVFALLAVKLADSLRIYLAEGERKIDRWFAGRKMALANFSDHPEMFRNINTPEELRALEREIGAASS